MAVSFRSVSTADNSESYTNPTGSVVGDGWWLGVEAFSFTFGVDPAIATPTGFTLSERLQYGGFPQYEQATFVRVGDATGFTVTVTGELYTGGYLAAFTGTSATPLDTHSISQGTGTTATATAINVTSNGSVVCALVLDDSASPSLPAGYTSLGTIDVSRGAYILIGAGSSGAPTSTVDSPWSFSLTALAPAAAGGQQVGLFFGAVP